jgi:hypothetical protein
MKGVKMRIFEWFKSFFSKAISAFKQLFDAAFPVARQIILGTLKDVALEAVGKLNSENLTNDEKREAAFKEIEAYAKDKGLNARDSLINALIEMTVLALKEE